MKWLLIPVLTLVSAFSQAAEVRVAVAANFLATLKVLAPIYEKQSGDKLLISGGSSGKLYAQIVNGAPYDVLLSADTHYPQQLVAAGKAEEQSGFVYATGRLVLWRRDAKPVDENSLQSADVVRIALANPKTAPYGAAAQQTLQRLGVLQKLQPKLVMGESVGQTFQFVATGNAQLGFIALSQVLNPNNRFNKTEYWLVPSEYYGKLEQQAVLLHHGRDNASAKRLLQFLQTDKARNVIRQYGYL